MKPWTFWWELWMRSAMAPFEAMAAASRSSRPVPVPAGGPPATPRKAEGERHKEEFLARRMRTELEVKGPQGIIDEGGGT